MNVIKKIEAAEVERLTADRAIPDFDPGDTGKVNVKVVEGSRERVQAYEGVVIAKKGEGINASFTVRKISYGEGVERVFPIYSPLVEEVTFRGIALGTLIARGLSVPAAVVLSSLAFAISHLQYSPAAMFVVFLSGVGFAILRLMSGTVLVPIIAHAAANADVLLLNWFAASPPT